MINNNIICSGYSGTWSTDATLAPAHNTGTGSEGLRYFYHTNHLGSASMITNSTGRADQHIQYLPFGELFVSQRNSTFDSRYKFSAKETDNETGYSYFGARYYDSNLSMWLSVDPLADQRSWVSPYSYCQNNPVMRVDPTGALDDEWDLLPNGKVKHANNNGGDTHHSLHAVDENRNRTGNSITVRNRDVLDDLDATSDNSTPISKGNSTGSIDDVFKVFLFGANNSNVEWGAARYNGDQYAVYSGNSGDVTSPLSLDLGEINANIHSHPSLYSNYAGEIGSMGGVQNSNGKWYPERYNINGSDWWRQSEGKGSPFSYVYFKHSKSLYSLNKGKWEHPSHIMKVNNASDLYFGTLNHR